MHYTVICEWCELKKKNEKKHERIEEEKNGPVSAIS